MRINDLLIEIKRIRDASSDEDKKYMDAFWDINKEFFQQLHKIHTRPDLAFYYGTFAEQALQFAHDKANKLFEDK